MAAGSSAPELFTAIVTTLITESSAGVGTIVGSAVFNIMVINGASAFFAGATMHIFWYPLVRDSVVYFISIILMVIVMLDQQVVWWESAILVGCYFLYIGLMAKNGQIVEYIKGHGLNHSSITPSGDEGANLNDVACAAHQLAADSGSTPYHDSPRPAQLIEKAEGKEEEARTDGINPKLMPQYRPSVVHSTRVARQLKRSALQGTVSNMLVVHRATNKFMSKAGVQR
jgi:Ca2+/Na+ antiporter